MDNAGKAVVAAVPGVTVWHNMGDRNKQRINGFLDEIARAIEEGEKKRKRLRKT